MEKWKNGIAWPDKLNTGNEIIDGQHRTLFIFISDLIDAHIKRETKEKFSDMLKVLVNYTAEHFGYEEKLMTEIKYPAHEYQNHKNLHDDFKGDVKKLQTDYENQGTSDELVKILENIVINWVIQHIQREDVKIAEFMRRNNII